MIHRTIGSLSTGEPVDAHILTNASGTSAQILNYGGIIQKLSMPDGNGRLDDVVLGFNDLDTYLAGHHCCPR